MKRFVIFISYSSRDEEWRRLLERHLAGLRCVALELWPDEEIRPGKDWKNEIMAAIYRADMAILLVSPDFLRSRFIMEEELPDLSRRYRHAALKLIPVIVEDCAWQGNKYISGTQVFPSRGLQLAGASPHDRETLLNDLRILVYENIPPSQRRVLCGHKLWLLPLFLLLLSLVLWQMFFPRSRIEESVFGDGFRSMCLPGGEFTMGSLSPGAPVFERPVREVSLSPYCIGKFEITVSEYFRHPETGLQTSRDGDLPMTGISWQDAYDFCHYFGLSLPTEAQWEYAARAGSTGKWTFGDKEELLKEYGWYSVNSGGVPHVVGTRKDNAWKIHDMHGNVWEWVADWHGSYPLQDERDPKGPAEGVRRVLRGGSYDSTSENLRSAHRSRELPGSKDQYTGFRCAREVR